MTLKFQLDKQFLSYWSKPYFACKILMPFLNFSDNLLQDNYIIYQKKCWWFWDSAQNMLNFGLGAVPPFKSILCESLSTQHFGLLGSNIGI